MLFIGLKPLSNFYIPLFIILLVLISTAPLNAENKAVDAVNRAYDYCQGDGDNSDHFYRPSYIIGQWGTPDPTDRQTSYLKFQFSIRQHLCSNLYFGYTQKSFWSITRDSSPFKDSNYAPEFFWEFKKREGILQWGQGGIEHESNGREVGASRSWNRLYWEPKFEHRKIAVSLKGWIPIKGWSTEGWRCSADLNDNPDILEYYGHGELAATIKEGKWQFGAKGRKGTKGSYGSIQGDVVFNLRENVGLYAQFWDGYGESLLDYNRSSTRYGIGFIINDLMPKSKKMPE